ncbi:MAG: hypothetical protein PVJ98_06105 [Akkermansiaceae bacterium]|jgi:hypothetical protein
MKNIIISTLVFFAALASGLSQEARKELRILIITDDDTFTGYMVDANEKEFLWRENAQSTLTRRQRLASCTVYFIHPEEYIEALELYKSRNYKDAAEKFAACAKDYERFKEVPANPGVLAGFYEMECYRRLEDLETLMKLAETFVPDTLLHEDQKLQYEIYKVFWDAVRTKGWARLDAICDDPKWRKRKMPGSLRAQIAYCQGLAREGIGKPIKALNSYNGAFVADFAASEEITRKSALNCLRIILAHEDVKTAMELYSTEDYSDDSNGAVLIQEATALLKLWDKVLGGGEKMPAQYKVFLKYPPKKG